VHPLPNRSATKPCGSASTVDPLAPRDVKGLARRSASLTWADPHTVPARSLVIPTWPNCAGGAAVCRRFFACRSALHEAGAVAPLPNDSGFSPIDGAGALADFVVAAIRGWGPITQPRQIARAASFAPDDLKVIFGAFDDAWSEIAAKVGTDPVAVETARLVLATVVLGLAANTELTECNGLAALAVAVFWREACHRGWWRRIGGRGHSALSLCAELWPRHAHRPYAPAPSS
jgi:hypothetical protein